MLQAGIERIVEQSGIVRAHVEGDRQAERGVDAGADRVQGQLAYRDAHAVGSEVAQAEDAFTVGNHDDADIIKRPVAQQFCYPPLILGGDVNAAGTAEDMAELETGLADRGGVDNGHQLLDIVEQYSIKQGFVAVLKGNQIDITLDIGGLLAQILQHPLHLFIHGQNPGGQQAGEAEGLPFFQGEGRTLVQARVAEQGNAGGQTSNPAAGAYPGAGIGGRALFQHGLEIYMTQETGQGFAINQVFFKPDEHLILFMNYFIHAILPFGPWSGSHAALAALVASQHEVLNGAEEWNSHCSSITNLWHDCQGSRVFRRARSMVETAV